jgi:hypothetical protein
LQYENFYVSSQEEELHDDTANSGKSEGDGSEFNTSKISTRLCVFNGEEVTFAKKAAKRSKSYFNKSSKPIAENKS